jgi:hydroxymethylbilane synthase
MPRTINGIFLAIAPDSENALARLGPDFTLERLFGLPARQKSSMTIPILRIGTRGSPLALAQTNEVRHRLAEAHPALAAEDAVEVAIIKTSGDAVQDRALADIGGKGLFTKEIDEAMLAGLIDLAVHSMKDVPTWLPGGIALACMLEREDPRDVFIAKNARTLAELAKGAVVGTGSLRRQAQILHRRPDLKVTFLRGNVETRLRKLREGHMDATLLALAGLRRLGLTDAATAILNPDDILPAVGQGAIGVTCRTDDTRARAYLAPLNHAETFARVTAERAMLEVLDGSCRTPIAGLAEVVAGRLLLRGLVARPDGSQLIATRREGAVVDAEALGRAVGHDLLDRAGPGFLKP